MGEKETLRAEKEIIFIYIAIEILNNEKQLPCERKSL
jgi:hypothetical protein